MSSTAKQQVLFLCTHNSCRSQMAEGLLNHLFPARYDSFSAGIEKTQVHPLAIQVMQEIGIDISNQQSKTMDQYKDSTFDIVVTVCDHVQETCPFFPGKKIIHQSFKDPSTQIGSDEIRLQAFRDTRDMIHQWILTMFSEESKKD